MKEKPTSNSRRRWAKTIPRHAVDAVAIDHKPVVWITAPAGSGKSVLAAQMCRRAGTPFVWLRTEPRMADMGVFLTSLLAAFQKRFPKSALPALASQDIAFPVDYLRRLIAAGGPGAGLTLVLDDLQVLPADAPPLHALAEAIRDDPDAVRVILVSREAQHPAWLRFNAVGKAASIGFEALKLDDAEASELVAQHGADKHGWSAAALIDASGGWILGARLLLQSPCIPPRSGQIAPDRITHDTMGLLDLIAQELVEPLGEDERMMLCRIASLPNLPIDIIARALDMPGGDRQLTRLAQRLLFVERDGQDRLQIHDLFKAALLHRYPDAVPTAEASLLSARAGQALVESGEVGEGLLLLSASGAWSALRDAVIEHAPALSEKGELGVVLAALDPMPQAEREESLAVRYWHGASLLSVNPTRAQVILSEALVIARTEGEELLLIPIWTALIDAIWFQWTDCSQFDPLIVMLPKLTQLARRLGPRHEAMLARGAFAAMSLRYPDHPDFPYWEQRNLDFYGQPMPRHETIRCGIQLLFRYCSGEGNRWKAEQVRARLNHVFEEKAASVADICTRHLVATEFLCLFEAAGDETFRAVEMGIEASARHQQFFWLSMVIHAGLFKAMVLEDRGRAPRYLALLATLLEPQALPYQVAFHQHFLAYDHWLGGEHQAALALLEPGYRTAERSGIAMFPVFYGHAIAAVLQSLGRRREALAWMRKSRRGAARQNSAIQVFLSGLRGAALALTSRRPERAARYLRPALAAGASMRIYLHAWTNRAELAVLLHFAVEANIEIEYATELIRVLGLAGELPPEADGARTRVIALGRFDILAGDASRLTSAKLQRGPIALAVHLIAAGPKGESAETLANRMWPDDYGDVRKRMNSTVYRLRQLIGSPEAVVAQGGSVALDPTRIAVDAWDLLDLATAPGWTAEARYAEALRLYRGPFAYHHANDTGLIAYGQKLEEAAIGACVAFVRSLILVGDWTRALRVARYGLEHIGYHESVVALAAEAAEHLGHDADFDASA